MIKDASGGPGFSGRVTSHGANLRDEQSKKTKTEALYARRVWMKASQRGKLYTGVPWHQKHGAHGIRTELEGLRRGLHYPVKWVYIGIIS